MVKLAKSFFWGSALWLLPVVAMTTPAFCLSGDFHAGGVGNCSGCHSMHQANSASEYLLLNSDPSSICINCHSGLGGPNSLSVFSPDGSALTPGGDFYWLTRSFSWLDGSSPGDSHGHNVVARDFNLFPDRLKSRAPGGTFPSAQLGCTSCHDPHGQAGGNQRWQNYPISGSGSYGELPEPGTVRGNYRLLGDDSYRPAHGVAFSQGAPIARQSSISPFQETDTAHVDYGSGMSEWCGNCHGELLRGNHVTPEVTFAHPAGRDARLEQEVINTYNTYLRTGDYTGSAATSYLQFVPFERGTSDVLALDPHSTQGPSVSANVMCLSCHRAHASAFSAGGRWDFTAALLVDSHPAVGDTGATAGDVYFSYYGRNLATEFGSGQGSFCEKCHGSPMP